MQRISFENTYPSTENYWRSIILFGNNVASYKFALAKSLLEFAQAGKTFVSLEELAIPYSHHLAEHLKISDKQTTSSSSQFLEACRKFNAGTVSKQQMLDATVKLGFNNVIDAFHNVNKAEIPTRFYIDERSQSRKGISLTDELLSLIKHYQYQNLPHEVEARWRLVETAWQLNISRNLIVVSYDEQDGLLFMQNRSHRRTTVTSCRNALNGYQKGKCFYCFADISVDERSPNLAHVDHFFPHTLKQFEFIGIVDGVWNLVLACQSCNLRKSSCVPHLNYLSRLHTRNEFLISSHHPLRETLISQTGKAEADRARFLKSGDHEALSRLIHRWQADFEYAPAF
ncbi:hypothetical protein NDA01_15155 [Trichocoleus desertorum AS-A10]|uniref:HNH endonuclease n=1 Tax=Trichocoleus desertorum TaxID=1481672 RepID=UPI00329A5C62